MSDFIARYGGKPCARCRRPVEKGQRVRFVGYSKALEHSPSCPPVVGPRVFFVHRCGCAIGDCVHGEDEKQLLLESQFAAKRASRRRDNV